MRRLKWVAGLLVLAGTTACGGSGGSSSGSAGGGGTSSTGIPPDLNQAVVTNLPPGNASGNALSGSTTVELRTLSCAGHCGPVPGPFGLQASYCDVGETDTEFWDLVELDGRLSTDINMDVDMHLAGGVDGDGHFDIGGYGTASAGSVQGTARATGVVMVDPTTTQPRVESGSFAMYAWGVDNGVSIDCLARYEMLPSQ